MGHFQNPAPTGSGRPSQRRRPKSRRGESLRAEGLEPRALMAAGLLAPPAVLVHSAATADSRGVDVSYDVQNPAAPPVFGVYRSADATLDADDTRVAVLDTAGSSAATAGPHALNIPVAGGLSPTPAMPYVIVGALNPDRSVSADPATYASFRTYSIAVVSHGGIQNPNWASIPVWEGKMVWELRAQGYDEVIPFNWVKVSNKPGYAPPQGIRMARQVLEAVAKAPAGEPIDLHLIGHSQGALVVSQAMTRMEPSLTPAMKAGFTQVTLLDPHSASTGLPARQYSIGGGPIGWIAKGLIDDFQSRSDDPPVVVPDWADNVEVFYQQTGSSRGDYTNRHIYNLWGQVPIAGPATYFDLTESGVTHAGKTGVPTWYTFNVVPTLGGGEPGVRASALSGAPDAAGGVSTTARAEFHGSAFPGSTVRLYVAPASSPSDLSTVGYTTAGPDGSWSLTTSPLRNGRYRTLVRSVPPRGIDSRIPMIPTAPLGVVVIDTRGV